MAKARMKDKSFIIVISDGVSLGVDLRQVLYLLMSCPGKVEREQ